MANTFSETSQRPFALPSSPWIAAQQWDFMLFLHWPVSAKKLAPHIPAALSLDLFGGSAWVSIVPFLARGTHLRGLPPFPFYHSYLEINIRTYVTHKGVPGVYFFSLGVDKWPVVLGARAVSLLPYYHAQMKLLVRNQTVDFQSGSKHPFRAVYFPSSSVFIPQEGSIDFWLLERYCLFDQKGGFVFRGDIHHDRWRVAEACCTVLDPPSLSFLPDAVFEQKPLAHFAHKKNVFAWPLQIAR
ncbi:DUF2071 domain-containing protein [Domibacillus sp. PGB-M46]|uniref:YqjF family protein n=1 Tax=Domibacillus sp. PGB-M46 TaxID=2910255 RepID=UPI001F582C66|nr:DUF2071 domain-containing protein [Domibacillus sp. PGB-M46]MCI2255704.1 DUF2071 domain-containing protein [Domibacillus sp. PGB-M46]